MKKSHKILLIIGIVAFVGYLLSFPGRNLAKAHVNKKTAVTDHPLNCLNCHLHMNTEGFVHNVMNKQYYSPYNLIVSKDGNTLYTVAQEGNLLLIVNSATKKVEKKIKVGERPHSVILNSNEKLAYVSNQWADNIYIINLESYKIIDTLITGNGPAGLAISPDNRYLYVVNSYSNDISVFDLETNEERKRLLAGNNPASAAMSPDGKLVYVTSRRTIPKDPATFPMTELTVVDTKSQRVTERKIFEDAYIMENVAFTPSGDLAIATLIRPKNLIPAVQVEDGWMMTHGIGIIEQKEEGRIIQLLTDDPNSYYPDPFDIVISPSNTLIT